MRSRSVVLVTIEGPAGREDVALAADVAAFQLMPALTELVGGDGQAWSATAAARWHLRLGERTLPPTRTLLSSGVVDGDELHLSSEG